jgi:hypothetical protein
MVRKGFITPQNKQHENSIVLRSLVLYFNIFSSQKLKAQKIDSDSLCPSSRT